MFDIEVTVSDNFTIEKNATYRLRFPGGEGQDGKRHFSAAFEGDAAPSGTLAFSFNGNPGDPPAVIDLAAGDNAFSWNVRVPFADVEVTGLPEGGKITLYCR